MKNVEEITVLIQLRRHSRGETLVSEQSATFTGTIVTVDTLKQMAESLLANALVRSTDDCVYDDREWSRFNSSPQTAE